MNSVIAAKNKTELPQQKQPERAHLPLKSRVTRKSLNPDGIGEVFGSEMQGTDSRSPRARIMS